MYFSLSDYLLMCSTTPYSRNELPVINGVKNVLKGNKIRRFKSRNVIRNYCR